MPVHFDGTDARISTTDSVGAPPAWPVTLATVVRFDTITRWHGLMSLAANNVTRGFEWEITNGNKLFYGGNQGPASYISAGSIVGTTWLFVASSYIAASPTGIRHFCYNLETNAIVFNETLNTGSDVYVAPSAGDDYTLGAWASTATTFGDFMDGQMAWAAVYNSNYNSTEAMLALATLGPYCRDMPVAFWALLDGVDGATSTVAREWRNGNTGTLTNVNFDANGGWRPMALPGPWWITRAAIRRTVTAAAPVVTPRSPLLISQAMQRASAL